MARVTVITAKSCLAYEEPGHPESPLRISRTQDYLQRQGSRFISSISCTEQDILRVHSTKHLESVRMGRFHDADTPNLPGMFEHAKLAAGAAIQAAELALQGEHGFSLMRPPGHHATRDRVMGFCYLNNIAIAVASILEAGTKPKALEYEHGLPAKRVAILDFDCHHGNGTEEIFFGHPLVLFASLHQAPCFPGTGLRDDRNCLNYPLPPGSGEPEFLGALRDALRKIEAFKPNLIAVSAGFDAYKDDPIAQLGLEIGSFEKIGREISQLRVPAFSVLEGGYSLDLPQCVGAYMNGLQNQP